MKKFLKINLYLILALLSLAWINKDTDPWKEEELMSPEALAKILTDNDKSNYPVIFNIGPAGAIPGSIEIGFVNDSKGIKKLESNLKNLPKDKFIVLYCGCCPFEHCPNIRPAFSLLNKKGFQNHKLLNLPKNLKVDWIDKGFPLED